MNDILLPVLILGALGFLFAIALGLISSKFKVETSVTEEAVRNALPGANCGACGYPGCDGCAAAIANKNPKAPRTTTGNNISFINDSYNPAKPINAIDISPRVIRLIGAPLKASGVSFSAILSLMYDRIIIASINPNDAARA